MSDTIHNEQAASARLAEDRTRLTDHRSRLKQAGLGDDEIKRVTGGKTSRD
jgi:hypothetical protein